MPICTGHQWSVGEMDINISLGVLTPLFLVVVFPKKKLLLKRKAYGSIWAKEFGQKNVSIWQRGKIRLITEASGQLPSAAIAMPLIYIISNYRKYKKLGLPYKV